jgi:hypothetical protein
MSLFRQLPWIMRNTKKFKSRTGFFLPGGSSNNAESNPDMVEVNNLSDAHIVTNKVNEDSYVAAFDIDMPVYVVDSSTPGHHHLVFDVYLTKDKYDKLLRVMVEVGLVEPGILEAQWLRRGYTSFRPPWVNKYEGKSLTQQVEEDIFKVSSADPELPPF